jgi:hypothetical protein
MQSLPPPWSAIVPTVLYMVLPALAAAAIMMAAVGRIGGSKQAPSGAALSLMVGAFVGVWLRDALPLVVDGGSPKAFLSVLPDVLTLVSGESSWNRLPWAVLSALCLGLVAHLADAYSGDGWLLRGGVAIAIAWALIPEDLRERLVWLAPAFAMVVWAEWVILDRIAAQPASFSVALSLTLSLLAAAGVLIHAGTARLMDATLVQACAIAGVLLVACCRRVDVGGAIPALAVALPGLLLMGQLTQAEEKMHWAAFALPACAPLLLVATMPVTHWPKLRLHLVRLALVLIPLAFALYLAHEAAPLDFGEE